jgi:hypothetical protein
MLNWLYLDEICFSLILFVVFIDLLYCATFIDKVVYFLKMPFYKVKQIYYKKKTIWISILCWLLFLSNLSKLNFRECSWHADLPVNASSTIIFRCDSFSVGRGQESGRCWGDTVSIHSPNNDTLTLCGKRDGIHLTLEGYSESLEIRFKSENNTISHGFACLVYTEEEKVAEIGEPDFDCKKISLYLLYSNVYLILNYFLFAIFTTTYHTSIANFSFNYF